MNLILGAKDDLASMNIYEHLLLLGVWQNICYFDSFPVFKSNKHYLVLIKQEKIYAENIDKKIRDLTGLEFDNIIVKYYEDLDIVLLNEFKIKYIKDLE